ncbi:hypothetical protein [Elioraea sp.]|uniref:hypothetical protein n=1 Tax=Elioraea sp. TaxID=2185103 RepID=UPI003F702192
MTRRASADPAAPAEDRDQAEAVLRMPAGLTAEAVAARLRRRFGASAWTAAAVQRFRVRHAPYLRRGKIEADMTLKAFVDARVGAMTLDRLAALLRERFGPGAPRRSSLQRYIKRERRRLNTIATQEART